MFWINFLINSLVFLGVFNFNRLLNWYKTRSWTDPNPVFQFFLPISLALLLTIIDSLRLFFAYQLAIFVVGGLALFWLASQIKRKRG